MNTEIIKNLIFDNGNVSKVKKRALTILDTLPYAITWSYNGINHTIENDNKLIPLILNDNRHIAIIQAPYNKDFNMAYIVNGEGEIVWNLKDILTDYRNLGQFFFSDVYYINNSLYFFIILNNIDYRFEFNIYTGEIGNFRESR